ncbi:MAG: DNA gyrase C-terminal beta-propeller domain-containing protein [Cytophagales bacterium]|nr:DNA gyrase C-terminal beta-propeller domain-containing protein [Cytophagales bacterium]
MEIIKTELAEIKERYGDARRTAVVHSEEDITLEDMIANEEMVITISNQGYIKRTSLSEYRTQGEGVLDRRLPAVRG